MHSYNSRAANNLLSIS
jgi:vacuolar protein sorting-associated protein 35